MSNNQSLSWHLTKAHVILECYQPGAADITASMAGLKALAHFECTEEKRVGQDLNLVVSKKLC